MTPVVGIVSAAIFSTEAPVAAVRVLACATEPSGALAAAIADRALTTGAAAAGAAVATAGAAVWARGLATIASVPVPVGGVGARTTAASEEVLNAGVADRGEEAAAFCPAAVAISIDAGGWAGSFSHVAFAALNPSTEEAAAASPAASAEEAAPEGGLPAVDGALGP